MFPRNFLFFHRPIFVPFIRINRYASSVQDAVKNHAPTENSEKPEPSRIEKSSKEELQFIGGSVTQMEIDPNLHRIKLHMEPEKSEDSRLLRVAILGKPNVGKSALMNALTGATVSAVSSKIHTTRQITKGILVNNKTQLVFLDTPGFVVKSKIPKKYKIDPELFKDQEASLKMGEMILVVHDVSNEFTCFRLDSRILHLLYRYRHLPSILVLNKVDILKTKSQILDMTYTLTKGRVNGKLLARKKTRVLRLAEEEEQNKKLGELVVAYKQKRIAEGSLTTVDHPTSSEEDKKTSTENQVEISEDKEDKSEAGTKEEISDPRDVFKFDRGLWTVDWETLEKISTVSLHEVPLNRLRKCFMHERGWPYFKAVFSVSAKHGFGIEKLAEYLVGSAKPNSWKYHSSVKSPMTPYQLATEIIRSKVFERIPHQTPYSVRYKIAVWEVNEHDTLCIMMNLICKSEYDLIKLIGKDSENVIWISKEASQDLSNLFGRAVFVKLNVKHVWTLKETTKK